jgi:hypothetical protein
MIENLCEMLNKDRNNGMPVRYVRCDNAGENKKLKKRGQKCGLEIGCRLRIYGSLHSAA